MENIFDIKELHVCIEKYYGFYHIFRNNKFALHSRTPGSMNKFKPQIRKKNSDEKLIISRAHCTMCLLVYNVQN